jgi:hypothetical protein
VGCSDTSQDIMATSLGEVTTEEAVVDALMGTLSASDPAAMRVGEFVHLEVANEIGGGMARGILTDIGRTIVSRSEQPSEIDFTLIETKIEYLEGNTNRKASTEFNFRVPKATVAARAKKETVDLAMTGGGGQREPRLAVAPWTRWRDQWSVSWQRWMDRLPIDLEFISSRAESRFPEPAELLRRRSSIKPIDQGDPREWARSQVRETVLQERVRSMLTDGEVPPDPEPPPARLYGLVVRDLDLPVPGTARSQPNCLGFQRCVYRAREVRFDALIEFNGRTQRLNRSLVVSSQVPFLARVIQTCDTTMVPIGRGTQRTLLKNCQTVRDFRFEQN